MKTRIYVVAETPDPPNHGPRLVRAVSAAQAVRHVTEPLYTVGVATAEQLVSLLSSGAKVEDAKQEDNSEQRKEIDPQASEVNGLALEKAPEEISPRPVPAGIAEEALMNSGASYEDAMEIPPTLDRRRRAAE